MTTLLKERNITTKLLIDELNMWDEFDIQKNQDPQVDEYYKTIINIINQQIKVTVNWLDTDDAKEYFYEETEYQKNIFQSLENEWDDILNDSYNNINELIETIYQKGKKKGYQDIKQKIRFTETDKLALAFAKNYNFELITKLDKDVRNQIKNKIIKGVIAGEHPSKIAPEILNVAEEQLEGSIFTPKRRATMIARTEVSRIQNTGILQSYVNEGFTEVKILTAEDNNVCYTCLKYAFEFNEEDKVIFENRREERVHNISKLIDDGSFPPFHPLCRCTYLSVWKSKGQNNTEDDLVMCLVPPSKSSKKNQIVINVWDEFNTLRKKYNIEWKLNTIPANKELKEEKVIEYYFKDYGITISKSIEGNVPIPIEDLLKSYQDLPKKLRENCNNFTISHQSIKDGDNYIGGFTNSSMDMITLLNKKNISKEDWEYTLIHELGHTIDGPTFRHSNSDDYSTIYDLCKQRLIDKKIYTDNQIHIRKYIKNFTTRALNGGYGKHRPYSEDFAECVVLYIKKPNYLFQMFPEKGDYINNIIHKYSKEQVKKFKGEIK